MDRLNLMRPCPNDEGSFWCEKWIWGREHRCPECARMRGNRLARERRVDNQALERSIRRRERDVYGRHVFGVL